MVHGDVLAEMRLLAKAPEPKFAGAAIEDFL
jgi:hypothetical protein